MGELDDRVSDADREQTVVALRGHLLAGRLTLEEFSERVDVAYGARTGTELARARGGLPETAVGQARRKPARVTSALFGSVVRRGRLRLRRRTVAAGAFCDIDLDLREAELATPRATVNAVIAFGNLDLYVPEGIAVTVGGLTLFGHRREWGRDSARPDGPVVHVRAVGLFGTIDVWRVPPDLTGDYGEVHRALQQRQRELPG